MNARDEGLSRANMDMFERSAARAFLGSQSVEGKDDHEHPTKPFGISPLAGALWLLTGPVAKADVVTDWHITAGDKSLPYQYSLLESVHVQVFGCRDAEILPSLGQPASEKRQGTKSRDVGHRQCSGCYGDLASA